MKVEDFFAPTAAPWGGPPPNPWPPPPEPLEYLWEQALIAALRRAMESAPPPPPRGWATAKILSGG